MIAINAFLGVYLVLYILSVGADLIIEKLNLRHLKRHGQRIPDFFQSQIDSPRLHKINAYTAENARLNMIKGVLEHILFLFIILSGLLPWLDKCIEGGPFLFSGLVFFAVPGIAAGLISMPFDYYRIFVIEEDYGFNTRTLKIWLVDMLKGLLVGLVLGATVLSGILLMVKYGGRFWWLWAWILFSGFQLMLSILYPSLIAPLFNKFTPVENPSLSGKIKELAARQGLSLRAYIRWMPPGEVTIPTPT